MPVVVSGNKLNINWVKGGWIGDGSQIFSDFEDCRNWVESGDESTLFCCCGIHKQMAHQFAASIRSCKPPNSYTTKGILHADEAFNTNLGPIPIK